MIYWTGWRRVRVKKSRQPHEIIRRTNAKQCKGNNFKFVPHVLSTDIALPDQGLFLIIFLLSLSRFWTVDNEGIEPF